MNAPVHLEPLKVIPDDKIVVLGLVTTKTPRREMPETLTGRIKEANQFVPLEQLALSPQCGFSTSVVGNRVPQKIRDVSYR